MSRSILFALFMFSSVVYAVQEQYDFKNAQYAETFKELTHELRCPKCQNQSIADSDAIVAKDLRAKVFELVNDGQSKQEVIDYMIDRFGYFVHYAPPVTASTIILWILPLLILICGFGVIVLRQTKQKKAYTWSAKEEEKLSQLIKQYQRKAPNS